MHSSAAIALACATSLIAAHAAAPSLSTASILSVSLRRTRRAFALIGFLVFIGSLHSLCHICDADRAVIDLPPNMAAHVCGPEGLERWPLYVFLVSALMCLGSSTVYHLCGTANERWYHKLGQLDYVGIVGLIVGSCTPVAWYSFGGEYHLERTIYLAAIVRAAW